MTILFIVSGFLIVNVMMGLFGILFQNIQRRKGEIGIRRALGATKNDILRHFVGETLVLTTFGVLLGVFFAIQFPIMRVFDVEASLYVVSILMAIVTIYVLVTICAFYPSKQASQIFPATALHED
jgi:putative ABC transport system permease protein